MSYIPKLCSHGILEAETKVRLRCSVYVVALADGCRACHRALKERLSATDQHNTK